MSVPPGPATVIRRRGSQRASVVLIIGLIVSGFCGALALLLFVATGGLGGAVIGLLLALPTAAVLVGLILLIDRLEPEPPLALVFAFAWGAGVAVLGSFFFESVGDAVFLHGGLQNGVAHLANAAISAPLVEESCKGTALVVLLFFLRNEFSGPTDGIVYASMIGLGFAMVENVEYYMQGLGPNGGLLFTVFLRGVISPLCHPLFTSMTGLGVAYSATHRGPIRFFAPIFGWIGAVALHGMWNGSTVFGVFGLAVSYLILIGVLSGVVAILVADRRRLVRSIRTYLPPYVPSGLVLPPDVTMLGTIGGRRQARRWARSTAGVVGMRAMGDYQLAATELAVLHANAAKRGMPPNEFYSRRDTIIAQMRMFQGKFFHRLPPAAPPAPPWAQRGQSSGFFELPTQITRSALPVPAAVGAPGRPPGTPFPPPGAPAATMPPPAPGTPPRSWPAAPGPATPGPVAPGPAAPQPYPNRPPQPPGCAGRPPQAPWPHPRVQPPGQPYPAAQPQSPGQGQPQATPQTPPRGQPQPPVHPQAEPPTQAWSQPPAPPQAQGQQVPSSAYPAPRPPQPPLPQWQPQGEGAWNAPGRPDAAPAAGAPGQWQAGQSPSGEPGPAAGGPPSPAPPPSAPGHGDEPQPPAGWSPGGR